MGTHLIPRDVEGEGRILIIFTLQGLIGTLVGMGIGFIFYNVLAAAGAAIVGWIIIALLGVIGFTIGQVNVPDTNAMPLFKKVGGEPIWKIIVRYVSFKKSKKIYVSKVLEEKQVVVTEEK